MPVAARLRQLAFFVEEVSVLERDYTMDLIYMADQIRETRELNGWSQEELADRADISRSTLYRIESGKPFPIDIFLKILDIAEVPASQLLPQRMQKKGNMPAEFDQLNAKNKEVVMNTVSTLINNLLLTQ